MLDYDSRPLQFHSHQLRDTFAVEHFLAGTSIQDLSKMLSHKTVRVTEKYYASWVPERQAQLEEKMTEALKKSGLKPKSMVCMADRLCAKRPATTLRTDSAADLGRSAAENRLQDSIFELTMSY